MEAETEWDEGVFARRVNWIIIILIKFVSIGSGSQRERLMGTMSNFPYKAVL